MKTVLHMRGCYGWQKIKYLVFCLPLYTETYDIYDIMKYSDLMVKHLYLSLRIQPAPGSVLCIPKMYISYKKMCTEILIPLRETSTLYAAEYGIFKCIHYIVSFSCFHKNALYHSAYSCHPCSAILISIHPTSSAPSPVSLMHALISNKKAWRNKGCPMPLSESCSSHHTWK